MQLNIDESGWNKLSRAIESFYKDQGRHVWIFSAPLPSETNELDFCFLVDRKHVVKYSIGIDRRILVGGIFLAIGPHYFHPAEFWDYKNSERFSIEASTEAVEKNLKLLDEFLGY